MAAEVSVIVPARDREPFLGEAIASALLGLCDPGDEVVVLEPYYDSYAACIAFAGATRRPVTSRPT